MTIASQISFKNSSAWVSLLNLVYPVGSLYFATNNTTPANRFGGTWSALNESKLLMPGAAWSTGGSAKISTNQLPSHTHKVRNWAWARTYGVSSWDTSVGFLTNTSTNGTPESDMGSVRNTGGGQIIILPTASAIVGTEQLDPRVEVVVI